MKEYDYQIEPKCVKFKQPALTAEGFFLPCCWCDRRNSYFQQKGFLAEELNINNVTDLVTEVFHSKPWLDFFLTAQYNPQDLPSVCKEHCGANKETKKRTNYESI